MVDPYIITSNPFIKESSNINVDECFAIISANATTSNKENYAIYDYACLYDYMIACMHSSTTQSLMQYIASYTYQYHKEENGYSSILLLLLSRRRQYD